MGPHKKLKFYYLTFAFGFTFLVMGIFLIMSSIESMTSRLEDKIAKRNLEDIADKDYQLDIKEPKDERVDFLNNLTDFFEMFHENTIEFKNRLMHFMMDRKITLTRFNRTDIKFHNMTIVPNKDIPSYIMKPRGVGNEVESTKRKQFP